MLRDENKGQKRQPVHGTAVQIEIARRVHLNRIERLDKAIYEENEVSKQNLKQCSKNETGEHEENTTLIIHGTSNDVVVAASLGEQASSNAMMRQCVHEDWYSQLDLQEGAEGTLLKSSTHSPSN